MSSMFQLRWEYFATQSLPYGRISVNKPGAVKIAHVGIWNLVEGCTPSKIEGEWVQVVDVHVPKMAGHTKRSQYLGMFMICTPKQLVSHRYMGIFE